MKQKYINKILLQQVWENKLSLGLALLLGFLLVGFDMASPWPFKILIDNVLSAEPLGSGGFPQFLHTLFPSREALGFFAVFVYFLSRSSQSLFEYLHATFAHRAVRNVTASFSKSAYRNLETLAIGFYSKQKIGDYIYRLSNDVSAIGELIQDGIFQFITAVLYLGITIFIMSLIDVRLTILSVSMLPFLAFGQYVFDQHISTATKRSELRNSTVLAFIEETLNHLKIIQSFSQEKTEAKEFGHRIDVSLASDSVVSRLDLLLTLLVDMIIAISYGVVLLYGVRAVFDGAITTGLLIVFIFYIDNLTIPIQNIIYAVANTRQAYIRLMHMSDFFNIKSHLEYHQGSVHHLTGNDIRFEHVTMVGREGKKILHDVSFTIEGGKTTVIFGGSGSGKTSVVNLIMRFLDKPTHGRILLGGTPIEEYDLEVIRDAITYVPQEITLFDDTIKNNIVFGSKNNTWPHLHKAARLADAEDFIQKLPGKYEFSVGEGGIFLSGGQRQRLMLARAFMKEQAEVIILDETVSALDIKSRTQVLHNVSAYAKGKTTIMVSNIFDMISAADNVIVLNHGRLLYSGPTKRLPKEMSLYTMITQDQIETTE